MNVRKFSSMVNMFYTLPLGTKNWNSLITKTHMPKRSLQSKHKCNAENVVFSNVKVYFKFCNCICTWDWLVHFRNSCKYISILWSLPWPLLPPVSSAVLLSEMMRIDLTWALCHIIIILFCKSLRQSKCAMKCENMWFSIFISLNTVLKHSHTVVVDYAFSTTNFGH